MTLLNATATPADEGTVLLSAQGLDCRRGRRLLLRGVNLSLGPGEIVWLRGANGSGKTSLLRVLAGLVQPERGRAWPGRGRSLFVGHANALKDDLTLAEAVAFLARLQGASSDRVPHALAQIGVAQCASSPVRQLSQGQRRRGSLARLALDAEAPVRPWILDEPYDALDQSSSGVLSHWIEAHAHRGGAVLLTSHQPVTLRGMRTVDLDAWCAS
jgi:heme exporter protein A